MSETRDPKETMLVNENHSLSAVDYRAEDDGLPACNSKYPDLHSSEAPYIINVKEEEDI